MRTLPRSLIALGLGLATGYLLGRCLLGCGGPEFSSAREPLGVSAIEAADGGLGELPATWGDGSREATLAADGAPPLEAGADAVTEADAAAPLDGAVEAEIEADASGDVALAQDAGLEAPVDPPDAAPAEAAAPGDAGHVVDADADASGDVAEVDSAAADARPEAPPPLVCVDAACAAACGHGCDTDLACRCAVSPTACPAVCAGLGATGWMTITSGASCICTW